MKMRIIIAPHPDDELWCLDEIKKGVDAVVYAGETQGRRDYEAIQMGERFKFRPVFCHGLFGLSIYLLNLSSEDIVWAPKINPGEHPLHVLVNKMVCEIANKVGFTIMGYTIDIENITSEQKEIIEDIYKSQVWLIWGRNDQ